MVGLFRKKVRWRLERARRKKDGEAERRPSPLKEERGAVELAEASLLYPICFLLIFLLIFLAFLLLSSSLADASLRYGMTQPVDSLAFLERKGLFEQGVKAPSIKEEGVVQLKLLAKEETRETFYQPEAFSLPASLLHARQLKSRWTSPCQLVWRGQALLAGWARRSSQREEGQ